MSAQDHEFAITEDFAGPVDVVTPVDIVTEVRREAALLKTGALQNAIFNSANFSSIATDEKGVIQLFNVGAERMLGYTAIEVYSDGLTEAQNQQEEMFGEERLLEIIQQEAPSGSHAVEQKFLQAIEEFTQGTPQTDDITFVVVEKCQ
jgi:PAS domain-containing protein